MVDIIDAARLPLEGWVVVLSNGMRLIGKPTDLPEGAGYTADWGKLVCEKLYERGFWVEPVYEMKGRYSLLPQGQQAPPVIIPSGNAIVPFLHTPTLQRVFVPPGAIVIPMSEIGPEDRRGIANVIEQIREEVARMRAAQAGDAGDVESRAVAQAGLTGGGKVPFGADGIAVATLAAMMVGCAALRVSDEGVIYIPASGGVWVVTLVGTAIIALLLEDL